MSLSLGWILGIILWRAKTCEKIDGVGRVWEGGDSFWPPSQSSLPTKNVLIANLGHWKTQTTMLSLTLKGSSREKRWWLWSLFPAWALATHRGLRFSKSLSIPCFNNIDILQNSLIDIDIFKNVLIDINIYIDIFQSVLNNIDILHIPISIFLSISSKLSYRCFVDIDILKRSVDISSIF